MSNAPNPLSVLQKAQRDRQDQARKAAAGEPKAEVDDSLSHAEALVQICVAAYAHGCTFALGALPDGSGIYGRLRMPGSSSHPCAGMVAFVVSDDPLSVLHKALAALDSSPRSNFWKPDQFAQK